jgi:hypothetical protein
MAGGQFQSKDIIVFNELNGMNTQSSRYDLDEKEAAWMENLQPIGKNNILSVPAPSPPLKIITGEIITKEYYFNSAGASDFVICFCASGAAYAITNPGAVQTQFAPQGTFSQTPDCTQLGTERILIADAIAGYSTWDGSVFVSGGGVSPNIQVINGGSYSTAPTVAISGGSGTGATAHVVLTGGTVTSVVLDNPGTGYLQSDVLIVSFSGGSPAGGTLTGGTITNGGSGYTSAPAVSFTGGGGGSGATATSTITGGKVTGVTITNPGTGYTTIPTVVFTGGAGTGASATVTVSTIAQADAHVWAIIMPNPTTLAVFGGRVWLANNNVVTYTGTGASYGGVGYDDFLAADASGSFTINDPDLVHEITALRSLNNYLFIFGDNSVKQIGNITVSGTVTSFTLVTLTSDQGTIFRDSIVSFNRLVLFANTVGVYAIFGTSVEKISDKMDGIFRQIDFGQILSAAVNDISNIHCFMLLVKYNDIMQGPRSLILAFQNKKWFVISQGDSLTFIVTGIVQGTTQTFSTSGSDVTEILSEPEEPVSIRLSTSLTSKEQPFIGKKTIRYAIVQESAASSDLDLLIESERTNDNEPYSTTDVLQFVNDSTKEPINFIGAGGQPIIFTSDAPVLLYETGNSKGVSGVYIGATLTGDVQSFSFNCLMIEIGMTAAFANSRVG